MKHIVLFFSLFFSAVIHGEVVVLKNGQAVSGSVTNQNRQSITVWTDGAILTLQKNELTRIYYNDETAEKQQELKKKEEATTKQKEEKATIEQNKEKAKTDTEARLAAERERQKA